MAYKFVGENMPELKLFPKEQRRALFLCAARRSYGHFSTWAGLCLWIAFVYCGAEYVDQINEALRGIFVPTKRSEMFLSLGLSLVGFGALYCFQMKAIKTELLEMIASHETSAGSRAL